MEHNIQFEILEEAVSARGYVRMLRSLRVSSGLTQEQVAATIGISRASYGRYERGRLELPTRHLIQLCALYNVSSDAILGLPAAPKAATANFPRETQSDEQTDAPAGENAPLTLAADQRRPLQNTRRKPN